MRLRVAGIAPESVVDGPGVRLALFVQGCSHRCPGCHNPAARDSSGGVEVSVAGIAAQVKTAGNIDGVTFTGGEPFEQAAPLAALAEKIHRPGLNLVLYTGYTFNELLVMSRRDLSVRRLLDAGWLLVDGPFLLAQRDLNLPYRGSRNQRLLDLPASLAQGEPVEWERDRIQNPEFRIQNKDPHAASGTGG